MSEQASTEENVVQVDDRVYKISDLSDKSKQHLQNVSIANDQKQKAIVQAQLFDVAASTMMAQLKESLVDVPYTTVETEEGPQQA